MPGNSSSAAQLRRGRSSTLVSPTIYPIYPSPPPNPESHDFQPRKSSGARRRHAPSPPTAPWPPSQGEHDLKAQIICLRAQVAVLLDRFEHSSRPDVDLGLLDPSMVWKMIQRKEVVISRKPSPTHASRPSHFPPTPSPTSPGGFNHILLPPPVEFNPFFAVVPAPPPPPRSAWEAERERIESWRLRVAGEGV